jgi:hypothetical protein
VIPKIRHVLEYIEYIRPGSAFFWDCDGAIDHDDAMRSLRLMGEEVAPTVHEIAQELELPGSFEVGTATGKPIEQDPAAAAGASGDD